MARVTARYLITRPGAADLRRYFRQPSTPPRTAGRRPQRVPANWRNNADPTALHAIAVAQSLNADLGVARVQLAGAAIPVPALRTFGQLVAFYKASHAWKKLRPRAQPGYLRCPAKLDAWACEVPVRAIVRYGKK